MARGCCLTVVVVFFFFFLHLKMPHIGLVWVEVPGHRGTGIYLHLPALPVFF